MEAPRKPARRVVIPPGYRPARPSAECEAEHERAAERVKAAIEIGKACFARLSREFGEPTAKLVMKRFAEIPAAAAPPAPAPRPPQAVTLPPVAKIEAMTQGKVCQWWRRIQDNGQIFEGEQKRSFDALAKRYFEGDGYQGEVPPMPPPLKQKGAVRRSAPKAAELPAMFDALKAKHPKFNKPKIAQIIFDQPNGKLYGKSADAIERAERNWRKKNRKV